MDKISLIVTRLGQHDLKTEIKGRNDIEKYHAKKAAISIGKFGWHNKHLLGIHEEGTRDDGIKIISHPIGKIFKVFVQDHPEIKHEEGESFEEAFGELIQHNRKFFNIEHIDHIGR